MTPQSSTSPVLQVEAITDSFEAALAYHRAGLCVIPLKGKLPALPEWKQYQSARPSEEQIRDWRKQGLFGNPGVLCGAVSGNLAVLDFDGPGGYPAFAATFPHLTETFTVLTGGGVGRHVYFAADKLPPTTKAMKTPLGNIELRVEGLYVAAPPAIHPETKKRYIVERPLGILRVADLNQLGLWIEAFNPRVPAPSSWNPPSNLPTGDAQINPRLLNAIGTTLAGRGFKQRGDWLHGPCINPEKHRNGDRNPSFGFNAVTGYGSCYVCGTLLTRDVCTRLGIDPHDYGGLRQPTQMPPVTVQVTKPTGESIVACPPPPPPEEALPSLSNLPLPGWLADYVGWSSRVGNQTPVMFHLGMGIWMASVAIARRVCAEARWGAKLYPNLYMMFIADTTFYRKTTAYKLGERILNAAIPHMLMPTPGSPERFQDALAGHAPSNFGQLPQEQQRIIMDAAKFAAQRGLFKDEIAGLFGAFKRDYMAGLKDLLLEVYDCPDLIAKETQSGLAVVQNAALSILGVTTPAGMAASLTTADWDNGLLPRFALLTPEPDYSERPGMKQPEHVPEQVISGLKALHEALPMPERSGDGWKSARALSAHVEVWEACQEYSNKLRKMCDPRLDSPLDDRIKGVYGRMHVQAMKIAMICATLDWVDDDHMAPPIVSMAHWEVGQAIAEHWRASAVRLLDQLTRNGEARTERWDQDRLLQAFRRAGPTGEPLRAVYRRLNLKAKDARLIAQDLVRAGLLVETSVDGAEAYLATNSNGNRHQTAGTASR
jgi:hypothetical protein